MPNFADLNSEVGIINYLQQQRKDRRARKPLNTVRPAVTGTLTVGGALSCTTGTWSGGAPHAFAYQWYRAGSPIGGATNATYVSTVAGVHYCVVTCTTVGKATQTAQSNSVTVA